MMALNTRHHIFLSIGLRAATLAGRFGLVIALAAIAPAEVVGLFGLYGAAMIISCSLMGMDVYATTTRELLADIGSKKPLRKHFGFLIMTYVLFLPFVLLGTFLSGAVHGVILLFFGAHLAVEYYSQEFGRLMVVVGMPLAATFALFVRSTLWVPIAILLIMAYPASDPILLLVICWFIGSLMSVMIVIYLLHKLGESVIIPVIDMNWMRRAIGTSLIFFIGTLLFRLSMNGDKFLVNQYLTTEMLGVYIVYASVAMGLLALAETGVSSWLYPGLVSAIQSKDWNRASGLIVNFRNRMIIGAISGGVILAVLVPGLLVLLNKPIYTNDLEAFYVILLGAAFYCISMPYHYVIYGLKKDAAFIFIYVLALLIMVFFGLTMLPNFGIFGAGLMLGIALLCIAFFRYFFSIFLLSKEGLYVDYMVSLVKYIKHTR